MRLNHRSAVLPTVAALLVGVVMVSSCGGGSGAANGATAALSAPPTPPSVVAAAPASVPLNTASRWQWQLRGTINTVYAVDMYDIDLFNAPQITIDALKARGITVVCYFSAGSSENFRPDFGRFNAAELGNPLPNYPDERWLDIRSANVRAIMQARFDLAQQKGCSGVEPDNVDGYVNNSGFPLDAASQLDFNRFLLTQAHSRNLLIGLKNDVAQIPDLANGFDFAVNEQCHEFSECAAYAPFTALGKPVFNAEYASRFRQNLAGARDAMCASAKAANLRTLVLPTQLDDSSRISCD